MPLRIGETFAGYRILRLLGSGGMGEVYLVQHPRLPREDALKVLRSDISNDSSFRDRFIREADLAAGLRHPHIVGVQDRGEHDGHMWIAMDYIDGTDAAQLLRQRYPAGMPVELATTLVTAVASALDYAHKKGLLHRDVKPANVIVADVDSDDPQIFLADFGIARPLDDTSGITTTNMTVGTVAYAAPEQLMGEQMDGRADQYALAATAYHLLTGLPLFPHSNPAVVISRHLSTAPPSLSDHRSDCAVLDDVLQMALAKTPDARFTSCSVFARVLSDGLSVRGAPSASAPTQEAPQTRRSTPASAVGSPARTSAINSSRRTWVSFAGLAAAILLIGVATVTWRPWERQHADSVPSSTTIPNPAFPPARPSAVAPAPPAALPTRTSDPALTGPAEGSDCSHAQINVVTTSSSGTQLRCTSGPRGFSWEPDTGSESPDGALVGQLGWDKCLKQFPRAKCVASAAEMVNSPNISGPVFPDGTYDVPDTMPFGTYAASPGPGGCSFFIYDSTGKLYNSGTYNNGLDRPTIEVNPFASRGRFQTVGCSPWVMMKPLSPEW